MPTPEELRELKTVRELADYANENGFETQAVLDSAAADAAENRSAWRVLVGEGK
jgi:hypothetical protein